MIRGEGETATPMLLDAIGTGSIGKVPGVVTRKARGRRR